MEPVYAYDQNSDEFKLFYSAKDWGDNFDITGVEKYLKNHLQKSLKDDFYPAYESYLETRKVGHFALPRIVFPYMNFLGTLFCGRDSTNNTIDYMNTYLSRVNPKYNDIELCDFIYRVYRHGLAHTNMPKVVSDDGMVFGWRISFDDSKHLEVDRNPNPWGKQAILAISPKILADEVISSIDGYIEDLKKNPSLVQLFKEGFLSMAATVHYIDQGRRHRFRVPTYVKGF